MRPELSALLLGLLLAGCASGPHRANTHRGDAATWPKARWYHDADPAGEHDGPGSHQSHYLKMRDGVELAVDVYLPRSQQATGARVPTILRQTRYFRTVDYRWPFSLVLKDRRNGTTRKLFLEHGYAWVDVDVRGSGASFGKWDYPWAPAQVADSGEVVDWIVAQPWSSGKVGATGVSYDGSAAEFLLLAERSAVKAIAPRFALFDAYSEIAFPGGIQNVWFTDAWSRFNRALDRNAMGEFGGWRISLAVKGVLPVNDDAEKLARALGEHGENFDVHAQASRASFRDDGAPDFPGLTIDTFSPRSHLERLNASKAAIYSYSGWNDMAYARSAIARWLNVRTPGSKLILGPWDHGGGQLVSPFQRAHSSQFDHDGELLRFFDHHLKGLDDGVSTEKPVAWYTMGEERWKFADSWPPPARATPFYLAEELGLSTQASATVAGDDYQVNPETGTGAASRWNSGLNLFDAEMRYPDRREEDGKLLCFTTAPLEKDLEVTGHPVAHLFLRASAPDATVFVYLEDVDPDGTVHHVTEGALRALHRQLTTDESYRWPTLLHSYLRKDAGPLVPGETAELSIELLPTSWLFKAGHAIRVAIAGADRDHFLILPGEPPKLTLQRGGASASRVELPIVER